MRRNTTFRRRSTSTPRRCSRTWAAASRRSAAYVGAQGRNLFLRTITNRITNVVTNPNPANAAFVIREFSIVQRDAAGNITGVQNPYAEVDVKTSGGYSNYNAMMLSLNRRSANGLAMNMQYTLGKSRGTTGGSNEANTAANNANPKDLAQFDYDNGYNNFDVRHTFNLSLLYSIPYGKGRKYGADAERLHAGAARRLGRRRHRQRPQRRADPGADCPSRRRLSRRAPATSSRTRRRIAWRSSTRPAAAPRATCAVRTWCPVSTPSSRTAACCS